MEVILHIGTHKTGSSAIQSFLATNRTHLLDKGIYYPIFPNQSLNGNFLGAGLAFDNHGEVEHFFSESIRKAELADATILLVSAESLYAMTSFFYRLYERGEHDYWDRERASLNGLRRCIPLDMTVKICAYVRRPDLFLESIYNQCVKHFPGFAGDIDQFLVQMREAMDYKRQFGLWGDVFGDDVVDVRSYDQVGDDVVQDFFDAVLGLRALAEFSVREDRVNERLNRDLLEYKRILNRMPWSRAESLTNMVQVMALSREMPDSGRYQYFLTQELRTKILNDEQCGVRALRQHWSGICFREVDEDGSDYPGLSVESVVEIYLRHRMLAGSVRERTKLFFRKIYYPLALRYPRVVSISAFVRKVFNPTR